MATRNVNLTPELDRFVAQKIESGAYENASELVRAALRALEREEREEDAKLEALKAALQEGLDSGIAPPGVFARVREEVRRRSAERNSSE